MSDQQDIVEGACPSEGKESDQACQITEPPRSKESQKSSKNTSGQKPYRQPKLEIADLKRAIQGLQEAKFETRGEDKRNFEHLYRIFARLRQLDPIDHDQ